MEIFIILFLSILIIFLWHEHGKLVKKLESYSCISDANSESERILKEARERADFIKKTATNDVNNLIKSKDGILENAKKQANEIIKEAKEKQKKIEKQYQNKEEQFIEIIKNAKEIANNIIDNAKLSADKIAGDALEAKNNADLYEKITKSMKNKIIGYGNEYIIPARSLLDGLAETYGYSQASKDFKKTREKISYMTKLNLAAECDYVENNRKNTAINFVVDAFNGKVETILSNVKSDNFGKLKQKIIDAFVLVNFNGQAFRNAKITEEYLNIRLEELRLACILNEIRKKDLEEQRQIKEQMREEEKARREIEKAIKEAAKQEDFLQKALAQAKAQLEKSNEEQRIKYENQIAELEQKWKEAEERNKRALSMAQQTKAGHVYIISNEGSFGKNIYKIGMTRRLEPLDRIRELSSASVPFPFDVHAMIWSEDAPALETRLHKKFALFQVNKVNYRKEFFNVSLSEIKNEIERDNLEIKWTISAEASEYQETLAIEKAISDNEEKRNAWLNHQIELENKTSNNHYFAKEEIEELDLNNDENIA